MSYEIYKVPHHGRVSESLLTLAGDRVQEKPIIKEIRPLTKADLKEIKEHAEEIAAAKAASAGNGMARFRWETAHELGRFMLAELELLDEVDVRTPKGFLIDLLVPPDRAEDMLLQLQKALRSVGCRSMARDAPSACSSCIPSG